MGLPLPVTGKIPGNDFVSGGENPYAMTRIGVITRVDPLHLKCDVKVITGAEDRFELDLTQAMCGPRSFLGGIPEVNSVVLIAYRRIHKNLVDAVILGYVPMGNHIGLRFDPLSPTTPGEVLPGDQADVNKLFGKPIRYKRVQGQPGDVLGMSGAGAEMHLSANVRFCNRAGDLFELRDTDRTILSQAIHRVEADGAAYLFSGPARRSAMNLSVDAFQRKADGSLDRTVKTQEQRYFGADELGAAGVPPYTFVNTATRTVLDRINNDEEFPPITFSNGRQAFYPSGFAATNFEDALNGGSGRAYTERRLEIRHDTDLLQEVLEEIDGFSIDRPRAYIEQVFGTVIGNDPFSTLGQRQYGRVLKPRLFEDFDQTAAPSGFRMEEAVRPPGTSVDEALNMAAAYLFRIQPPQAATKSSFAVAVSKQGKLFANIPGSTVENGGASNVSAELNLEGALKARIGAATPDRISAHITCAGAVVLDIGSNAEGQAVITNFNSSFKATYKGTNDTNDVARSTSIIGNDETTISGNDSQVVNGAYIKKVSGGYSIQATRINQNALNGYTGNFGEWNMLVSGKSQFQLAQLVQETIVTGGKVSTILAGGLVQTLNAGALTYNVQAGATTFNNPAGAFAVNVGTGAISVNTTSGAVSLTTGSGAVSISTGAGAVSIAGTLAVTLTAGTAVSMVAPQILLGGPAAVLGVSRGTPLLPPGAPSLDWVTGLPLQGSAVVRSM